MSSTPEELQEAMNNIDWKNAVDVECSKCGSTLFAQRAEIKKLSPIVSPTGQELILPMTVFACVKCNHVNEELRMPIPK